MKVNGSDKPDEKSNKTRVDLILHKLKNQPTISFIIVIGIIVIAVGTFTGAVKNIVDLFISDMKKEQPATEAPGYGVTPIPGTPPNGQPIEPEEPGAAPDTAVPPVKAQRVEVKDFIFQLQSCKLSGQTLSCYLTITNKGNDRQLAIGISSYFSGTTPTRMIDDSGNEYMAQLGAIGSSSTQGQLRLSNLMVSGIPTKAVFKFEGVSPQLGRIALLELDCESNGAFKAQVRNIPLSRNEEKKENGTVLF